MLRVTCPTCQLDLPVAVEDAGKQVKCTLCGRDVAIPTAEQSRAQRASELSQWLEAVFQRCACGEDWPPHQIGNLVRPALFNDTADQVVLTIGQVLAVLGCIGSVVGVAFSCALLLYWGTGSAQPLPGGAGAAAVLTVLGGAASFAFWLAVFVAFGRAKWVGRLRETQQATIHHLQQHLTARGDGVGPRAEGPEPGR